MTQRKAQTLTDKQLKYLMTWVEARPLASRAKVMLLLSYKAGLRSQEIAGLTWANVTDAVGNIGRSRTVYVDDTPIQDKVIFIPDDIAKYGKERHIPLHRDLMAALGTHKTPGKKRHDRVILSVEGTPMTADTVRKWFKRTYEAAGLEGCSSHSGRRTLITKLAQAANSKQCSLADVQAIAGHSSLMTTQKYIELSPYIGRLIDAA
jgi:integrase/recombinase XerD